jgi:TnpA family transposase
MTAAPWPGDGGQRDSETKYGRYDGPPSRAEIEKIFFLDNEDMALIKGHRGRHIRCGFALQLVTVRYPGCFPADPLEVPNEVLDVVAAQLESTIHPA